jgi:hypothetical protein
VNLLISFSWFDPLYDLPPLALAGFVTAVLLSVPWFAKLFPGRHKDSR